MWAAYNAYVLMHTQEPHSQCDKRVYTFHFFREKLCVELVGDVRNITKQGRRRSDEDAGARLTDCGPHKVERAEHAISNNYCIVCNIYRRTKLANPALGDKDLPKRSKTV